MIFNPTIGKDAVKRMWHLTALSVVMLVACSEGERNDIYLCGNNDAGGAFYTVNERMFMLSPDHEGAGVSSMRLYDGKVYCAGSVKTESRVNKAKVQGSGFIEAADDEYIDRPALWIDGKLTLLDQTDGAVNDFAILRNGEIWCVGYTKWKPVKEATHMYSSTYAMVRHRMACVWVLLPSGEKKYSPTVLTADGNHESEVLKIYDDGECLHLMGYDEGTRARLLLTLDNWYSSKHWSLGYDFETHTDTPFAHSSQATAIFGSGKDYLIVGWQDEDLQSSGGRRAVYKEGEWEKSFEEDYEITILDGGKAKGAWYAVGYELGRDDTPRAFYYKNGVANRLEKEESPVQSGIHAMAIAGADVYMAGYRGRDGGYWKNDKFVRRKDLTNCTLTGIAVVEKK